jgi:histidinol-phosphate phosphatase family protein
LNTCRVFLNPSGNFGTLARGIVSIENLYLIHKKIREDFAREGVEIAGFYYAPYSVESNHPTRKPNAGMLLQGASDFGVSLPDSFMIGDRTSDVEAGHRAGTKSILLAPTLDVSLEGCTRAPELITPDVVGATEYILSI